MAKTESCFTWNPIAKYCMAFIFYVQFRKIYVAEMQSVLSVKQNLLLLLDKNNR